MVFLEKELLSRRKYKTLIFGEYLLKEAQEACMAKLSILGSGYVLAVRTYRV